MHLATLEMDAGPILAQQAVPVLAGDTEESLHERIKVAERALYPATVAWALGRARGRTIDRHRAAGADPRARGAADARGSRSEEMTT